MLEGEGGVGPHHPPRLVHCTPPATAMGASEAETDLLETAWATVPMVNEMHAVYTVQHALPGGAPAAAGSQSAKPHCSLRWYAAARTKTRQHTVLLPPLLLHRLLLVRALPSYFLPCYQPCTLPSLKPLTLHNLHSVGIVLNERAQRQAEGPVRSHLHMNKQAQQGFRPMSLQAISWVMVGGEGTSRVCINRSWPRMAGWQLATASRCATSQQSNGSQRKPCR